MCENGDLLQNLLRSSNDCLVDRVRSYSEETGTPFERCVHDALTEWLTCVAEPNLEAFRIKPKHKLKIVK